MLAPFAAQISLTDIDPRIVTEFDATVACLKDQDIHVNHRTGAFKMRSDPVFLRWIPSPMERQQS